MRRLIAELWQPFLTTDDAQADRAIHITEESGRWQLEIDGRMETEYENPWRAVDHLRHTLLEAALTDSAHLIILHGAVLEKEERVLVLAGESGAGKTTLAIELLQAGWNYVSDDVAPLDPATNQIISFPKPLNVKDLKTWRTLVPRWTPPEWSAEPAGGLPVPADAVAKTSKERVAPTHLVFCRYEPGGEDKLEDLGLARALALSGELVRRINPPVLGQLRTLVEGTTRARLRYREKSRAIELLHPWLFRSRA